MNINKPNNAIQDIRISNEQTVYLRKEDKSIEKVIIATDKNDTTIKKIERYNEFEVLIEEGVINNEGKYAGEVNWYYENGTIKIKGYYNDKTPYGNWIEYYNTGEIMANYSFINGMKEGSYYYYHINGQLWTERIYKSGLLWEIISNYDKNGNAIDHGDIVEGTGTVIVYNENGIIQTTLIYKNGILQK